MGGRNEEAKDSRPLCTCNIWGIILGEATPGMRSAFPCKQLRPFSTNFALRCPRLSAFCSDLWSLWHPYLNTPLCDINGQTSYHGYMKLSPRKTGIDTEKQVFIRKKHVWVEQNKYGQIKTDIAIGKNTHRQEEQTQ